MTIEVIMAVCTSIVTFAFAELSKKFKLVQNNYIPLQNLTIGFLAGIFAFVTGISDNIIVAIALCILSAFGAGGAYDLGKTRKEVKDADNEFPD